MSGKDKQLEELIRTARDHHDPDIRFMAIRELTKKLDAIESISSSMQDPFRQSTLHMLRDKHSDVQTTAVKMLGTLVRKMDNAQVQELTRSLVKYLVNDNTKDKKLQQLQREQFQTAIKKCVKELRTEDGAQVGGQMVRHLSEALKSRDENLQLIVMDLLTDVVSRFGKDVKEYHEDLLYRLLSRLVKNKIEDIPIRAANTIGALSRFLSDELFLSMMEGLMKSIEAKQGSGENVTYINTVGVISREVGFRVGDYLKELMPKLQASCTVRSMKAMDTEEDEKKNAIRIQLWEACLMAFESFFRGCPDKMDKYAADMVELFMAGMRYDPNFVSSEDGADLEEMELEEEWGDDGAEGEGGGWGEEGDGGGWGDDEDGGAGLVDETDLSWKIRQQATMCMAAFITTKKAVLKETYPKSETKDKYCDVIAEFLEERLGERDETVRIKVLEALKLMVRESAIFEPAANKVSMFGLPPLVRQKSWKLPHAKRVCTKVLSRFKGASVQIRSSLFDLLQQLCITLQIQPGMFMFNETLEPTLEGMNSTDMDLQARALDFLHTIASVSKDPKQFRSHIGKLVKAVGAAAESKDRIKLHALKAAGSLAYCIDQKDQKTASGLFRVVFRAMKLRDVDDEVKRGGLAAIAQVLTRLGPILEMHNEVLPVIMERLRNSSTQLSALQSLCALAESGTVKLKTELKAVVDTLTKFMRSMTTKEVKYEAARTLTAVVRLNPGTVKAIGPKLLKEAVAHISDTDTHLCSLVLSLVGSIVESKDAKVVNSQIPRVLDKMLTFAKSPLVDSQALTALVNCFKKVSTSVAAFSSLQRELEDLVDEKMPSHNVAVVAKCIAAMAIEADARTRKKFIQKSLGDLKSSKTPHQKQLALLALGGIGSVVDLSEHQGLDKFIFDSFSSSSPTIRSSASYALGNIAAGNIEKYLPDLLSLLESKEQFTYLLLRSVREVIMNFYGRGAEVGQYTSKIFAALVRHTNSKEDAVRGEVAECLGWIAKIEPDKTFKFLEGSLQSKDAFHRAVAVGALRFALGKETKRHVAAHLPKFLSMFTDRDLEVRRQAALTFDTVLQSTELMNMAENSDVMKKVVVPVLYRELKPNEAFIKIIDAGPVKIRDDKHQPLRRAAFDALATIAQICAYRLNMKDFYAYTMQGILDADEEIVVRTWDMYFQIVSNPGLSSSLKELAGGVSREEIEGKKLEMHKILLNFVKKKMQTLKGNQTRETVEASECVKKALMTIFLMVEVPGMDQCKDFCYLVDRIKKTRAIAKEREEADKLIAKMM